MAENLKTDEAWTSIEIRLPPELKGYGPSIRRFVDAMVFKLRRNAHKGKWEDVPMPKALSMLDKEWRELIDATKTGSTSEILMEAADVANQALIVAEIAMEARGVET